MSVRLTTKAIATSFGYYARKTWSNPPPDLGSLASRSLKICEGKLFPAVRPYFQEEHAKQIRDGEWYSASQLRTDLLSRRQAELRPLFVHEFRDAFLVDGSIYLGSRLRVELRSKLARRDFLRRMSVLPVAPHLECSEATLVSGVAGSTWFGHWLVDELPLQVLASNFGSPISHLRPEYRDERIYQELLKS